MSIKRLHTNIRMSQIVVHNNTVYLAGQVGESGASVADQTRQALVEVERLLAEAGSSPEHILQAVIWLADMKDFEEMNAVWDAWVPTGHAPVRACGEARLAEPGYLVELLVTAAISE
ncbi:RidA family protein [Pseudomonas lopnurensis]|uniref:RidA family protein n=1 Tax=Pseudomonas lopnurensis TaxID=1477517 RepID=UPI0028AF87DC|nr:RidA family protein [Pseudomonas lopnurensis]